MRFFTASAEKLQGGHHVHFRIVEFRCRRRIHDIAIINHRRIGIGGGDMAVTRNVFIKLHMHKAVFFERVPFYVFRFSRGFKEAKRFGDRHLIDKDLVFAQFLFGNAVAGLDD